MGSAAFDGVRLRRFGTADRACIEQVAGMGYRSRCAHSSSYDQYMESFRVDALGMDHGPSYNGGNTIHVRNITSVQATQHYALVASETKSTRWRNWRRCRGRDGSPRAVGTCLDLIDAEAAIWGRPTGTFWGSGDRLFMSV